MGTFEAVAMVAALGLMFAAVGAKIMMAQLITRMKTQISQVAQVQQGAMGRLKMVQSQKKIGEKNKAVLTTKKGKLAKKLTRLKKEIGEMEEEQQARRQRTDMRKVE